jgi:anthranilate synthase component 1
VRWVENIPQKSEDDLQLDDAVMMFFSNVLAFDHVRQQILIISNTLLDDGAANLDSKYEKAVAEIDSLEAKLNRPARIPEFGNSTTDTIKIRSIFRADYLRQ